jgi:hypothetical protein
MDVLGLQTILRQVLVTLAGTRAKSRAAVNVAVQRTRPSNRPTSETNRADATTSRRTPRWQTREKSVMTSLPWAGGTSLYGIS